MTAACPLTPYKLVRKRRGEGASLSPLLGWIGEAGSNRLKSGKRKNIFQASLPPPTNPCEYQLPGLPAGQHALLFAMRVVHQLALVVEHHDRALVRVKRLPRRQQLMIRIAAARERNP